MFDVFDPEADHGRVYRALVSEPRGSVQSLANRTSLPEDVVRDLLGELQQAEIVVSLDCDGDLWEARRPDLVVAGVLRKHDSWRVRLHQAEASLMDAFRFARLESAGSMDVELVHGQATFFARFQKIQEAAKSHVLAIDRPPYYWDATEIDRQEKLQCEQMAAGIGYRTIYQESASDSPVRNASMMRTITGGEIARVLTDPPVKMTIVDDEVAIVAMDPPAGAEGTLVIQLVYGPGLLEAFTKVFESLWRLAVPINLAQLNQDLNDRTREILTMMASGATDDAIARRLGLSRRTVVRIVAGLLEQLGATTRFQAGAQAARRGWL
ncbi:helix-turn-helix transcriptional regulator [Fodinicola feengrottensis]|uniref:HTH luxR-type domain-containing protein n=1 Tax=Fodinicola feengrottensis TaxID=435914 RepID=A0ABN2HJ10_9ACTN|nr:helix-turn-helix transcriptional regulator [Fodinicola feengrottensis]